MLVNSRFLKLQQIHVLFETLIEKSWWLWREKTSKAFIFLKKNFHCWNLLKNLLSTFLLQMSSYSNIPSSEDFRRFFLLNWNGILKCVKIAIFATKIEFSMGRTSLFLFVKFGMRRLLHQLKWVDSIQLRLQSSSAGIYLSST